MRLTLRKENHLPQTKPISSTLENYPTYTHLSNTYSYAHATSHMVQKNATPPHQLTHTSAHTHTQCTHTHTIHTHTHTHTHTHVRDSCVQIIKGRFFMRFTCGMVKFSKHFLLCCFIFFCPSGRWR